jgi:hypothetical protein
MNNTLNINKVERIARVGIGILIFYLGTQVTNIKNLFDAGYYISPSAKYLFARIIASSPNIFRITGWFIGFVLIFTGINGFCPFYKLFHVNTNKN